MDYLSLTPISVGVSVTVLLLTIAYLATVDGDASSSVKEKAKKPLKLPLIGDLHSSPIDKPLLNWDAWAQQNGPLPTPKLFGIVPMVIINTSEAVTELFSRRSSWYSNRPPSWSMEAITDARPGQSKFTLMHDYDDNLRLHHRLLSPSLGAVAAPHYQPLMELESTQLLQDILECSRKSGDGSVLTTDVYPLLERTQSSVILSLHYGLRIPNFEDPLLHEVIHIQQRVTHLAANPQLPDLIPVLRRLPAVLSPWKRSASKLYAEQLSLYMRIFDQGKASPGWNATKQALASVPKFAGPGGVADVDLAFTLATSVQGGMETSPRQVLWLFVAGLTRPGWWAHAQQVIDEVVGRHRLPRFSDRPQLAFTDAVAHELFRWRPISPGSIPRRAEKADEYNGVRIARGVTLMANAWAIGRDPAVFDPALGPLQDFIPERWLTGAKSDGAQGQLRTDLPLPVFGQGRRMCQGKRVAVDGTFLQVTRLLWAFDIEPVDQVDSWSMDVVGFMTVPPPFRFRLKPRGPWVEQVIAREWQTMS